MKKQMLCTMIVLALLVSSCGVHQGDSESESSGTQGQTSENVSETVTDSETETTTEIPTETEKPTESEQPTETEQSTESEQPTENPTTTESQNPDDGGNGNVNDEPVEPTYTYTYTDMTKTMYAKSSVNVRDLPTADGNKLGKLSEGAEVKVTGQCNETKWYRIEFGGKVAYVSNKYLTTEKPEEEENEEYLSAGYSWEDRDGDGFADLPKSVVINGWNVRTKDISPEFAKFKRELSEEGYYVVKSRYNDNTQQTEYYVLAPTIDEAFEYLEKWLLERGMKWGHGKDGWWDTDRKVAYCLLYEVYEIK